MKLKLLPVLFVGCLTAGGCGSGGGDDTIEDNSVTIINDAFNQICNVDQSSALPEEGAGDSEFPEVVDEAPAPAPTPIPQGQPLLPIQRELAAAQADGKLSSLRIGCDQDSNPVINGTSVDVDAAIQNLDADTPLLSEFLATGEERP